MRAHGIGDTDAACQEGSETHEGEEQCDVVDKGIQPARGLIESADAPAGVGMAVEQLHADQLGVRVGRQAHIVRVFDQAAVAHELGRGKAFARQHHARPRGHEADGAVGFVDQGGAELQRRFADFEYVADVEFETRQQRGIDHRAVNAVFFAKSFLQRNLGR